MNHQKAFEVAWGNIQNTAIELPPADINKILHSNYQVDRNFSYTRTQLWDMEIRKAYNPDIYLEHLLRRGSLQISEVAKHGQVETFVRVTDQRMWKDSSQFTTVIERVFLNHENLRAFFIGVPEYVRPDGTRIIAGRDQPLFHVEHSAAGSENEPVNVWRIVLLAQDNEGELREAFHSMANSPYLREFVEIHIRRVLGKEITRK